jgi:hemerythrin-like metal-binding protein
MSESTKLPSKPAPPTGSGTVDAEHGVQLGLLEAALAALADEAASARQLVEQLSVYTQTHFLSEQLLMRLAARSNYEGHLDQHELLMQDLDAVGELLERGDLAGAAARLKAHETQLLEHIRSWDRSVE